MFGLRCKMSKWTGLKLSSVAGLQSTLDDELQINVVLIIIASMLLAIPPILTWFTVWYKGRTLVLTPPYTYVWGNGTADWNAGGHLRVDDDTLPIKLSHDTKKYFPLVSNFPPLPLPFPSVTRNVSLCLLACRSYAHVL